jgi:hypothetical protein
MPKSPKNPAAGSIPESEPTATSGCCTDWRECVNDFTTKAQDFAKKEPAQAVGLAFIAGLVLTILPVGRIFAGILRLAFVLIRPALLILGAIKVCEEFEKRNNP